MCTRAKGKILNFGQLTHTRMYTKEKERYVRYSSKYEMWWPAYQLCFFYFCCIPFLFFN